MNKQDIGGMRVSPLLQRLLKSSGLDQGHPKSRSEGPHRGRSQEHHQSRNIDDV